MQIFKKMMKIIKPEDNKILIDIQKPGHEVDVGFKRL